MKTDSVVILGSGPSLDGFDYGLLSGRSVIAVNDAGLLQYPESGTLISTDLWWWMSVIAGQRSLALSRAAEILCTEENCYAEVRSVDARVRYVRRVRKAGLSDQPSCLHGIYTGAHAALNHAFLNGAQRIVLLGVDLKPAGARKYTYGGDVTPRTARQFVNMMAVLESCAVPLAQAGVKVVNGSPDSALTCWPRMRPEEALAQC